MAHRRYTILGCGSSGGVPRLGNQWGACDPENPKNRRLRCSLLVEQIAPKGGGITRVLIDSSPDVRAQLLAAEVGGLDAVVYTHSHADHMHGIDDLRMIVINTGQRLPVWADAPTAKSLKERFGYTLETPPNSSYPPILALNIIDGPFTIDGAGGAIEFTPFKVKHGATNALGFRISNVAYLPDVEVLDEMHWSLLADLDVWIVDALRYAPHPSHSHFEQTLEWIARVRPKRAILTNMHTDLDYDTVKEKCPPTVEPAFDMMALEL